jgi:hypothetical protein
MMKLLELFVVAPLVISMIFWICVIVWSIEWLWSTRTKNERRMTA